MGHGNAEQNRVQRENFSRNKEAASSAGQALAEEKRLKKRKEGGPRLGSNKSGRKNTGIIGGPTETRGGLARG